jgi:N-methylhydantoinase A/oxoprolinase/acetone carboxylase beta subunit
MQEFSEVYGAVAMYPQGGIELQNFVLHSIQPQPKIEFPRYPGAGKDVAKSAYKGERSAYWEAYGGFHPTPIVDRDSLKPENVLEGPAIVEGRDTTVVLEPGAKLTVDPYLNFIIEKV